jgi:hypothetical protein
MASMAPVIKSRKEAEVADAIESYEVGGEGLEPGLAGQRASSFARPRRPQSVRSRVGSRRSLL